MFTGLVQDIGTIERVTPRGTTDLWIRTSLDAAGFELGESIAIDGACLTVVERSTDVFKVQAAPETLRRTTLDRLGVGHRVNLERALRLSDRLGGHLVLGHVDAVAEITATRPEGDSTVYSFSLPAALRPWFIEKGSVAVDGVSLTVMTLGEDFFEVMLIPQTRSSTTLGAKGAGSRVNLEADLIGKYVARLHALGQKGQAGPGITLDLLKASGFVPVRE